MSPSITIEYISRDCSQNGYNAFFVFFSSKFINFLALVAIVAYSYIVQPEAQRQTFAFVFLIDYLIVTQFS